MSRASGKGGKTRAVDLDCPKCGTLAGTYCNGEGVGVDLCIARINLAVRTKREANQKLRGSR